MDGPHKTKGELPAGIRIYVLGDIHGALGPLQGALKRIEWDREKTVEADRTVLVTLGDYGDRGERTKQVLDTMLRLEEYAPGCERVLLRGNHDEWLMAWMDEPIGERNWLAAGGHATCRSYGVEPPEWNAHREEHWKAAQEMKEALPQAHLDFLKGTRTCWNETEEYFFSHAGIDGRRTLEKQLAYHLLWGDPLFCTGDREYPKTVVHGHWAQDAVEWKTRRINIDTNAWMRGRLAVLRLEGREKTVI